MDHGFLSIPAPADALVGAIVVDIDPALMPPTCEHGEPLCEHGRCATRCDDCAFEGWDWWLDEMALDRLADDGGIVIDGPRQIDDAIFWNGPW